MNKLNTADEIREWAKGIVDAKGEKFTPLSKGDLFAVASFILELDGWRQRREVQEGSQSSASAVPDTERDVGVSDPPMEAEAKETGAETEESGLKDEPPKAAEDEWRSHIVDITPKNSQPSQKAVKATMTRNYAYHRAGYTVQQAYDEFLKWAADHPKDAKVMDFSTGSMSSHAAFAFWLGEIIELDVPENAR